MLHSKILLSTTYRMQMYYSYFAEKWIASLFWEIANNKIIILKQHLLFNKDAKTSAMVPALKEWLVLSEAHSYAQHKTSQKIFFLLGNSRF